MTIVTNSNSTLCLSYSQERGKYEREDIAKVTELAYGHFQQSEDIKTFPNFDQICNLGKFKENLFHIQKEYEHDTEVSRSVASVENLQKDLSDLIHRNNSLPPEKLFSLLQEKVREEVTEHEITESVRRTVPLIIDEILLGRGALRTWKEEVDRWRNIPIESWPPAFRKQKPIFLVNGKLTSCPMKTFKELCLRKDYKEVIAFTSNLPIVHDAKKFEQRLQILEHSYSYDQEVVAAIKKTKELRQDISEILERNPNCTLTLLPIYISLAIGGKVKDSSKVVLIVSIIQAVLLERRMIRTQSEEVNRWKRVPLKKWPSELKKNGVCFLDDDNEVKHCSIYDFEKLVASQLTRDKVTSIAYITLLSSILVTAACYFYSKR